MKLELKATPEEVMRAVEALQDFGRARRVPERTLFGLALSLEECGSNIVNYALQRDPQRQFTVCFEHTGDTFLIELRDGGPEFDPTSVPVVENLSLDGDRPPGGWGIQLVRHYMSEMHYRREAGENVLCLIQHLSPPSRM